MFSKLSVFVASVLLTLAAAMPAPNDTPPCCTSVVSSSSTAAGAVAAPLGLDLTGLDVPVGLSCTPITVAGDNCGSTTVTCDTPDPAWGGLIAINCIPITA
ncbi:hydrophobin 2 [Mycena leptocephala]|nr:hydrophobin 2 [Mycena leptocephala]